jgi:hypothetical protein
MMLLMKVQDAIRVNEVLDNIYHLTFSRFQFLYSNRVADLS